MKASDYLIESARTAAGEIFPGRVSENAFTTMVEDAIDCLNQLDKIKKGLFYNRDVDLDWDNDFTNVGMRIDKDLLHGILGVATEANELLELLPTEWNNGPVNTAKIIDESGDVLWYLAMIFRKLGVTFEQVMQLNIEKLRVRFPEKFTTLQANERDTSSENKVFA